MGLLTEYEMKEVTYECPKCHAKDTPRFMQHETPFLAINCWKCHNGQGMDVGAMVQQNRGMFPIDSRVAR